MNIAILKIIVIPAFIIFSIIGAWFIIYEDENVRIDARLTNVALDMSWVSLDVKVLNKMNIGVKVINAFCKVYADSSYHFLVASGSVSNIYIPASSEKIESLTLPITNLNKINDKIYFIATFTILVDGTTNPITMEYANIFNFPK